MKLVSSVLPEVTIPVDQPKIPDADPPKDETPAPKEPEREPHPMDGETDDKGTPFDPSQHLTKRRKTKKFNVKGIWMPRRQKAPKPNEPQPSQQREFVSYTANRTETPEPEKPREKHPLLATAGRSCAALWYQLNSLLHAEDAAPRTKQEDDLIVASFQECVDQYSDIGDVPPWVGLSIALGQYELIRFASPKAPSTREKMIGIGAVVKQRFANLFGSLFGRKKPDTENNEGSAFTRSRMKSEEGKKS